MFMSSFSRAPTFKKLPARSDGRRTLLVYMDPALIKDLKKAALDEERNVYEIVEDAARDWLSKTPGHRGVSTSTSPPSPRKRTKTTSSAK